MKLFSKMKRPGAMLAGIFSLALASVVLLCGAGSVPIENFSPQGAMQTDLNAGGHNLTNVATVSATNVVVSGSLSAANLGPAATNAANSANGPVVTDANNNVPYDPHGMGISSQSFTFLGDSIYDGSGGSTQAQMLSYLFSQGAYARNHCLTYATTGTLTAGTATFTVASATGLAVGQFVSAAGTGSLSPGTVVSGVSGTTITVNPAPTGSGAATLTFTNVFNLASSGAEIPSGSGAAGSGIAVGSLGAGNNNVTYIYNTFVRQHRPSANGGDGGLKSTIFLLIGTNDIGTGGYTASQVVSNLSALVAAAQGDGFAVICGTLLPRSNSGWTSTMEGYRETVNQDILDNTVGSNYPPVDWESVVDTSNSKYSSDQVHPNALANADMALYLATYNFAGGSLAPACSYGVVNRPVKLNQGETVNGLATFNGNLTVVTGQYLTAPVLTLENGYNFQGSQISIFDNTGTPQSYIGYGNSAYIPYLQLKNFIFSNSADWIFATAAGMADDIVMSGADLGAIKATGNYYELTAGKDYDHYFTTLAASGTANPGFVTVTGTATTQTLTLPSPSIAGLETVIKNQSSQVWTISSASGSQIVVSGATGASAATTVSSGAMTRLWSDGTHWNQQ